MTTPKLLSGGNPQIPKGYGDGPVADWIAAAPGWKGEAAAALDALIVRTVPGVKKAVKWNSPFYAAPDAPDDHWFLSCHCFDRYLKVTFFQGGALTPPPPETSKYPAVRYAHIHEGETLDEAQWTGWLKQATQLPGEKL